MNPLSFFSAMDQSERKFKLASHCLSFLSFKTKVPFKTINQLTLRNALKLAKKEGFDPTVDWRSYPCKWYLRDNYDLKQCGCEPPCEPQ